MGLTDSVETGQWETSFDSRARESAVQLLRPSAYSVAMGVHTRIKQHLGFLFRVAGPSSGQATCSFLLGNFSVWNIPPPLCCSPASVIPWKRLGSLRLEQGSCYVTSLKKGGQRILGVPQKRRLGAK